MFLSISDKGHVFNIKSAYPGAEISLYLFRSSSVSYISVTFLSIEVCYLLGLTNSSVAATMNDAGPVFSARSTEVNMAWSLVSQS